jgi:hypothetical protein
MKSLKSHAESRLSRVRAYFRGVGRTLRVAPSQFFSALRDPKLARLMAAPITGGDDVAGARGTGNAPDGLLQVDMGERILELEPDSTPLLIFTKRAAKRQVVNPRFTWWEDELRTRFDTITEALADGVDTTIIVANVGIWAADDLGFLTATNEVFRVVSVNSGTSTLTVVRGVGGGAAAAADNAEVINIGSAAEEGSLDKPARSGNPAEIANYTQIFRTPVDTTGTRRSTADRTMPHDNVRAKNKAGIEHAKDIEYAAMLGRPSINTSGTHPRRTTGGFDHFATENVTDVSGAMTEAEFFAALRTPYRYGQKNKLGIAAPLPIEIITAYARTRIQVQNPNPDLTYGVRVTQVITGQGVLNLVTHWLLEGERLGEEVWIVDLQNVGYRYLHGENGSRETHIRNDIHDPGYDGKKDEYLTECGFVFGQPDTHGKITGITS